MSQETAKVLAKVVWVVFFIIAGLTFYVNHYMPHGPSYPSGDIICQNDGRGPCGESLIEDMSELDIPGWAKFLRRYMVLVFLTIGIGGLYLSAIANGKIKSYDQS